MAESRPVWLGSDSVQTCSSWGCLRLGAGPWGQGWLSLLPHRRHRGLGACGLWAVGSCWPGQALALRISWEAADGPMDIWWWWWGALLALSWRWLLSGHRVPVRPRALNLGPPGRRGPWEGPPGRQQHVPLIWAPQQLPDCGASPACLPACLVPPVTNSPTPGGLAGHMVSALCPFSALGGREEGNKTELLGELQRYTLVIKRSFQVFH